MEEFKDISIESIGLSNRSVNGLLHAGLKTVAEIVMLSYEDLLHIKNLGKKSVEEICAKVDELKSMPKVELAEVHKSSESQDNFGGAQPTNEGLDDTVMRETVIDYLQQNDAPIEILDLTDHQKKSLRESSYSTISSIAFLNADSFTVIKGLGVKAGEKIVTATMNYIRNQQPLIKKWNTQNVNEPSPETTISGVDLKSLILRMYETEHFAGFSLQDILEHLNFAPESDPSQVKQAIAELISEKQLEYVDFRCYRIYKSFRDVVNNADSNDRNIRCLKLRMQGETLEYIGNVENLTRESVRQIVNKTIAKLRKKNADVTFDEDYYAYLYSTYDIPSEAYPYLPGFDDGTKVYLDSSYKCGKTPLSDIIIDKQVSQAIKLRLRDFLNRGKIKLNGRVFEAKRPLITEYVLSKFARDALTIEDFVNTYNSFLSGNGISEDSNLLYLPNQLTTCYNMLTNSHKALSDFGKKIRYYDIESVDFEPLFLALNLDTFENIELSTLKLFNDHPELMEGYDIRNHYELHNLLKKTLSNGSYHGFSCGKMPVIRFGKADRYAQYLSLLENNAPISFTDFSKLIIQEYGFETSGGDVMECCGRYYSDGIFRMDWPEMPADRLKKISRLLKNPFYYIHEIEAKYLDLYPNNSLDVINPFTLKQMGFLVYSGYVIKGYPNAESYFRDLILKNEFINIDDFKKQYANTAVVSALDALRAERLIYEISPTTAITVNTMKSLGMSTEFLSDLCEKIHDYVPENTHFTIHHLKKIGFDFGRLPDSASDWFISCIVAYDKRFRFSKRNGVIILRKGSSKATLQTLLMEIVSGQESIETAELIQVLDNDYGISGIYPSKVRELLKDTNILYDEIFDSYYNEETLPENKTVTEV